MSSWRGSHLRNRLLMISSLAEHRMGSNYLAHRLGDAINAILAAVGYTFRLLRRFIAQLLLRLFLNSQRPAPSLGLFTFDYIVLHTRSRATPSKNTEPIVVIHSMGYA